MNILIRVKTEGRSSLLFRWEPSERVGSMDMSNQWELTWEACLRLSLLEELLVGPIGVWRTEANTSSINAAVSEFWNLCPPEFFFYTYEEISIQGAHGLSFARRTTRASSVHLALFAIAIVGDTFLGHWSQAYEPFCTTSINSRNAREVERAEHLFSDATESCPRI